MSSNQNSHKYLRIQNLTTEYQFRNIGSSYEFLLKSQVLYWIQIYVRMPNVQLNVELSQYSNYQTSIHQLSTEIKLKSFQFPFYFLIPSFDARIKWEFFIEQCVILENPLSLPFTANFYHIARQPNGNIPREDCK